MASPKPVEYFDGEEGDIWYDACEDMESDDWQGEMNTAIHAVDDSSSTPHCESFTSAPVHNSSSGGQLSAQEELNGIQNTRLFTSAEAGTSGQVSSTISDTSRSCYPAHRAAFYGHTEIVLSLLQGRSPEELQELDSQGNTVMHVAVLRQQHEVVQALLEFGFPLAVKNSRRWEPIDEAISLRDRAMVKLLLAAEYAAFKAEQKAKRAALLQTMQDLDDFTFKLKWELGSPLFGLILRRYAPHDTYEVWKKGTYMRVDGSLQGVDDKAGTLIPTWKRGHFSLLFDGAQTPASLLLVDHLKRSVVDLTREKKKHKPDLDDQVSLIMTDRLGKTKMKASEFRFKPVKTWFGGDQTEKIEGWKTFVYEAAGKMKAVTITKAPISLQEDATFEDYLAMEPEEDSVRETYIDPMTLRGPAGAHEEDIHDSNGSEASKAALEAAAKGVRTYTGRCWMAENFPMSLRQLLPILDIVGTANKHLARAGKFLQKYGNMDLFPVKIQVPLLWTVYALLSFRNFHALPTEGEPAQDSFFQAPEGYRHKALHESLSKDKKKNRRSSFSDGPLADLTEEDLLL
ncbi:Ankyrin repeat domain-containing protein 13B [Coccomyxa sp. Obi]|nr:Ankyrin repeat domain-containing protein 13B [Coccomyxa sp. Obi]